MSSIMTYLPGSAAQHLNNLYVHEASDISSDIHLEGSSIELVLAETRMLFHLRLDVAAAPCKDILDGRLNIVEPDDTRANPDRKASEQRSQFRNVPHAQQCFGLLSSTAAAGQVGRHHAPTVGACRAHPASLDRACPALESGSLSHARPDHTERRCHSRNHLRLGREEACACSTTAALRGTS
eukprot:scaffold244784_cov35-Tisochrysis_lutea.AAC.1